VASNSNSDGKTPVLVTPARSNAVKHAAPPPQGLPPSATEDWRRILSAIRSSKWLVIGVTTAGTLAGLVGARLLKPSYEARATVWVEIPDPRDATREKGPIQQGQLFETSTSWLDLLRSHVVVDSVARDWRLYLEPKSAADTAALTTVTISGDVRPGRYRLEWDRAGKFRLRDLQEDVVLQEGGVGDPVGAIIGLGWTPPASAVRPGGNVDFKLSTVTEAGQKLGAELRIRAAQDGNFITIARRGADPARTTGIVNAVAERFVAAAADLKRQRLKELTAILRDQLDHSQANLRTAEAALTTFRVHNAVRPSEGPAQGPDGRRITADPTYASYIDLQVSLDELQRDRTAIARVLTHAADSGVAVDQLAMIGAVQHSSELTAALKELTDRQADLRAMRFRYADSYQPLRRLSAQVDTLSQHVIPNLARAVMTGMTARERVLTQQRDSIARDLRTAPPVALSEIRLARDQTNAEQLFSNLQQRYEEARLAEVSTLPDVRILERAVPPSRPTSNTAPLLIIAALLTSFGAGVAGAVVRERADPKVRYPDHVTHTMGLPILGAVPHVRQTPGKRESLGKYRGPEADAEDGAKAVEALRGIRLNVHHAAGAVGPLLITITSPGRGEGKSFVSANLAYAFSAVGYRTLLIDGDVRLGGLHRPLRGIRRPGLTDILANRIPAAAAVQTTAHDRLWFVGAGSRMHRGPELLCSDGVPQLLNGFRSSYDVILVDSAPLAAGVDPYALGAATGNVLLVMRTGVTDRGLAEAKVEMLHRLPLRVLGAVLNDVRPGTAYSYYSYSLEGYEVWEEDPQGAASKMLISEPQPSGAGNGAKGGATS
jgi:capsular exopolysaccharide synthesis family protein